MCADSFSSPFTENVKQNNKRFVSRGGYQIKWQKSEKEVGKLVYS